MQVENLHLVASPFGRGLKPLPYSLSYLWPEQKFDTLFETNNYNFSFLLHLDFTWNNKKKLNYNRKGYWPPKITEDLRLKPEFPSSDQR